MNPYLNDEPQVSNFNGFSNSNQQDELNLSNDRELQNQLEKTKERIRTRSKQQINEILKKFDDSVFMKKIEDNDSSDQEKE